MEASEILAVRNKRFESTFCHRKDRFTMGKWARGVAVIANKCVQ